MPREDPTSEAHYGYGLLNFVAATSLDRIAVVSDKGSISYGELINRAHAAAHRLLAISGRSGAVRPVAILVERSADAVALLLGCLLAGRTFVALDPAWPVERVDLMIRAAECEVVVSDRHSQRGHFPRHSVLDVAEMFDSPDQLDELPTDTSQPAYVTFTSGSTGGPRGVAISREAFGHFVNAAAEAFQVTDQDRVAQFFSLSFDASIEEIFPVLLRGGTLVVFGDEIRLDVNAFEVALHESEITGVSLPPTFWSEWMRGRTPGATLNLPSLRYVALGGEALNSVDLNAWFDCVEKAPIRPRLLNAYGSCEACTFSAIGEIGKNEARSGTFRQGVGAEVRGARIYLLDPSGHPVPDGHVGEAYIGGRGVGLGYVNSEAATRERFMSDGFAQNPLDRMFRTGDLMRRDSTGNLEFVGRADDRVKISGHRVELADAQSAVQRCFPASPLAVVAVEDSRGDSMLVAFIAAPDVEAAELRRTALGSLPGFLVPSDWVAVGELPLTPSRKVDRRRLQDMYAEVLARRTAPAGGTARSVEEICERVLGHAIHAELSFVHQGGTSLLAVRIVAMAAEHLNVHLPVTALLSDVTLPDALKRAAPARRSSERHIPLVPRGLSIAELRKLPSDAARDDLIRSTYGI